MRGTRSYRSLVSDRITKQKIR